MRALLILLLSATPALAQSRWLTVADTSWAKTAVFLDTTTITVDALGVSGWFKTGSASDGKTVAGRPYKTSLTRVVAKCGNRTVANLAVNYYGDDGEAFETYSWQPSELRFQQVAPETGAEYELNILCNFARKTGRPK